MVTSSNTDFQDELIALLPTSSARQRKEWAHRILNEELDLKALSNLLYQEQKVATRFAWLLSELGEIAPQRLFRELPYLFGLTGQIDHFDFTVSFAMYWRLCGVPEVNEPRAINLLFGWLRSAETNVTIKSRALFVLYDLSIKYPELKNELKLSLENQMELSTPDFQKRAYSILNKLAS